ncbi:CMRF35-like molecule 5 [Trichomycterus rosablanca]|uniref:CMRF35-like molecule 5 n=1 Tax=Trichomycterus rosablanca TaxID=2290929 RepID=UPI002F34F9FC
MPTSLRTLSFIQVLACVMMKSRAERVITGTEGGKVEIDCKYSDEYKYTTMYFCQDPCGYSDVLIQSEKAFNLFSKGRYTAINTVYARSFSVTIRNLTLRDTGVYYCGIEKWGKDKLIKVKVIVTKAPASELPSATIVNVITTGTEHPSELLTVVHVGVFGLLLCCAFVTAVVFYRKCFNISKSFISTTSEIQMSHQTPNQEINDEIWAVHNLPENVCTVVTYH